MSDLYYVKLGSDVTGPFAVEDLQRMAAHAGLTRFHRVSTDRRCWLDPREVEGLLPARRAEPAAGPPPLPPAQARARNETADPDAEVALEPIEAPPAAPPLPPRPPAREVRLDVDLPVVGPERPDSGGAGLARAAAFLAAGAVCVWPAGIGAIVCTGLAARRGCDRAVVRAVALLAIALPCAGVFVLLAALAALF